MADDLPRLWKLSDKELLTHFELNYPQSELWQLCHLRPKMHSSLISVLHKQRPAPESLLTTVTGAIKPGTFGLASVAHPTLHNIPNSVHVLQVFATRIRDGRLAPTGKPVGHGTVSTVLHHVGQMLAYMGTPDPHVDSHGHANLRLKHQLRHYSKSDPPSKRIKPIPIQVLCHLVQLIISDPTATESCKAIMDLIILAYYFLIRPGKYFNSGGEDSSHPFHSDEIELWPGQRKLNLETATDHELLTATFCMLPAFFP
jgi:hypothetical protein